MIFKNVLDLLDAVHAKQVGQLAEALAVQAGLSAGEAALIGEAAVYHDIGKISIPESLLKANRPLTAEERLRMQRHVEYGLSILSVYQMNPMMDVARIIVATHHEHWDGSGYPRGLKGEQIPLCGRIVALCDVFDALTSERSYKNAWSVEDTLEYIAQHKGSHFDPALANLFIAMIWQQQTVAGL
ncbi:HD-GYP domain-containing protein [Paenibacillus sonchi]|uniref:HD-GYP domain-containing protein n=1 Tax=Paenibacillus sonchi TaxID=373687 RepID=A0A974P7J1_9BACL|nr:HD-GYP domain-containing protein [Paenibacillus sonchi]QQZ58859.1 HD-GYP domain-containing protein [Paenibacillus sonchi]